jgi:hypothetical protein
MSSDIASQPSLNVPRQAGSKSRRLVLACMAALAGLFGLDAALFRSNLYPSLIEPDSSTGMFEMTLRREVQKQSESGDNLIVTLGDSRFNYAPRLANELTPQSGYVFRSADVPGSDPRTWYYMLRDLDSTASRYRAIVFGVDNFYDEDGWSDNPDDIRDLHYTIARLRLSDIFYFAGSFPTWPHRWEAFRGATLKGFVLQRDVQAFLSNPAKRIEVVEMNRRGYEEWTYNYVEEDRSLKGLAIDWPTFKVTYPPGAEDIHRDVIEHCVTYPVAPQTGRLRDFRRKWFGKILDRYAGSKTKLIFVRLARGPIARPDNLLQKDSSSIREFGARPNVVLSDEHAFDSLERPELFKDGLHLNREGCARFSSLLVKEISSILGPPQPR